MGSGGSAGKCCVGFVRALVIIFNILFFLCALALIALGIWLLVDPNVTKVIEGVQNAQNSHLLRVSAGLLIAMGALLVFVSLLGLLGAALQKKIALGIYLAILIIVFCGEIAGGVLAIVFKDALLEGGETHLRDLLTNKPYYKINSSNCELTTSGEFWNLIQTNFDCCGVTDDSRGYPSSYSDCKTSDKFPASCYKESGNCTVACQRNLKTEGCLEKFENWIGRYSPVLIGIGLGVAMLQMIGIIFAVCLCVNVPRKSKNYKRHSNYNN